MFHRIDRLCSTGRADTSRQHLIFRNPCLALNPVEDAVGGLHEVHVHHTGFVVPRLDEDVELWFLCLSDSTSNRLKFTCRGRAHHKGESHNTASDPKCPHFFKTKILQMVADWRIDQYHKLKKLETGHNFW